MTAAYLKYKSTTFHGKILILLQLNKLSNLSWQTASRISIFKDLLEHSLQSRLISR